MVQTQSHQLLDLTKIDTYTLTYPKLKIVLFVNNCLTS